MTKILFQGPPRSLEECENRIYNTCTAQHVDQQTTFLFRIHPRFRKHSEYCSSGKLILNIYVKYCNLSLKCFIFVLMENSF